jgi:AAA-like domain
MAFHRLNTTPDLTLATLDETAADTEGPFGEHLRSLLVRLQRRPELRLIEAMRQAERHGSVPGEELFQRLSAAGLARREGARVVPANLLYARFFRAVK